MVKREQTTVAKETNAICALLVADSFDARFAPIISNSESMSSIRLANVSLLHYTLEWLARAGVCELIVAIGASRERSIHEVITYWKSIFNSLIIVSCRNCMSVGDVVREVHSRSIITGDFVLITNPATLVATDLSKQLNNFIEKRKNKNNVVMSLVYSKSDEECAVLAYEKKSGKLLFYNQKGEDTPLSFNKTIFGVDAMVHNDLRDSGIAFCSLNICSLFSDNFDFQHKEDIIREILVNEEILCHNICVDILAETEAAFCAGDYDDLLRANRLILQRWCLPLVPGEVADSSYVCNKSNIYLPCKSRHNLGMSRDLCFNGINVSLGWDCKVGVNVVITNTSVGERSIIEDGALITNCLIGDNVTIGANAKLSDCYIANEVKIGQNVSIQKQCVIGVKVSIPDGANVASGTVISSFTCDEDDESFVCTKCPCGYEWRMSNGRQFWRFGTVKRQKTASMSLKDANELAKKTEQFVSAAELDAIGIFHEEVHESMERIAQDLSGDIQLVRNLILEINSSKLAYNVSMEDVARYVFLSYLSLRDTFLDLQSLAKNWHLLFTNYYKPLKNQVQALIAMEEHLNATETFKPIVAKLVHLFYDLDILEEDAILEWYQGVSGSSPIKTLVMPIVNWLQNADEEE